jgi:poly-beta-1,6-N-acetyl-D-glucosamine synthase
LKIALDVLLGFVALYPVLTAAMWIAGGVMFKLIDERRHEEVPAGGWPGVTILIPAYNEEAVIATSVRAALASDYPLLEVLVLDDGSEDDTAGAARAAAQGDARCEVVRDEVNRGKAERLNIGFTRARHDLILVTDADAHLEPAAVRRLVARMQRSPMVAAVAGGPFVTNRAYLIAALQVLEAAAVIGLIRRTHSLTGRVGVVAGVCGLFRRDAVLAVGGYDDKMATEDIDLTWRLLLVGWHTAYAPDAVVGMEVPTTVKALWAQRKRWARGQGEVLHKYLRTTLRWRHHKLWLLTFESVLSLLWCIALVLSLALAVLNALFGHDLGFFEFGLSWGVAISVIATVQLLVAMWLRYSYDHWGPRSLLIASVYPAIFWLASAAATLHSQLRAVFTGPREKRVVWDVPREQVTSGAPADGPRVSGEPGRVERASS